MNQLEYVNILAAKKALTPTLISQIQRVRGGEATTRETSALIDQLKVCGWKPATPNAPAATLQVAELGYYKFGGEFYTVCQNRAKTRSYAKVFSLVPWRDEDGEEHAAVWKYVRGMVTTLRPEHKVTIQEAKDFGHLHGRCLICARVLSDPKSVEQGIGPICITRL